MASFEDQDQAINEAAQNMHKRPRNNAYVHHVICASRQSPLLNLTGLLRLHPVSVGIEEFFPPGHIMNLPALTLDGNNGTPNGLEDIFVSTNENDMRERLATYLSDHHNIDLQGCAKQEVNAALAFTPRKYTETSMNVFFRDLPLENSSAQILPRVNVALPVTTSSGCDMIALRDRNIIYQREPIMGEMKNSEKYRFMEGRNQAFLYCLCHLYDARVLRGLPMETAYGFAVNGPLVDGVTYYSVTLVRAHTTSVLSTYHAFEVCSLTAKSFNDLAPLQTLVHFLKHGNTASFPTAVPLPLSSDRHSPCRFLLPTELWNNDQNDENSGKLFLTGTCAIVFQGTKDCLGQILRDHAPRRKKHTLKAIDDFQETLPNVQSYVLKIPYPLLANDLEIDGETLQAEQDLSVTYPIDELSDGFVFMRFRGNRILPNTFSNMDAFKTAFAPIWISAMHLCLHCSPGDTLPHNMVFDGTLLHLIDAEEAFSQGIMERPPPEDLRDENWLEAVRYPDYLRENVWAYALVQLTYSCCVITRDIPKDGKDIPVCSQMQSHLKKIGISLLNVLAAHNGQRRIKTNPAPLENPYNAAWENALKVVALDLAELLGLDWPSFFPYKLTTS